MPTPTDPTTPTTPTVPDMSGSASASATAIGLLTTAVVNLGSKISDLLGSQNKLNTSQKEGIDITQAGSDAFDLFSIRVLKASDAFSKFNTHSDALQNFTTQLSGLGTATDLTTNLLVKLATAGGASSTVLSGGADMIKGFVTSMASAADNAINLQNGYLSMAGASGQLGKAVGDAGTHFVDMNATMLKHRTLVDDIAGASGASAQQVAGFYQTLGSAIPGFVNQQVDAVDESGKSMNGLQAAMTLASGTGRDFTSIVTDMTTAYENFNASEKEALEWTNRMTELSNKFGINLSYTKGFLEENAKAFKMISDNAGDADKTFNRMFESFKNTGLSAKQSTDVITQMTGSLSHLTTAQKAFLSAQTGGPGGLRGAFQIDNLLREGKIDEVLQKAEDNLKKNFGGRIYTQKEAGESDYAASQFQKQRTMVQSGAFGSLVKDDATAARVLEAMKNGTSATSALKDPGDSLAKTIGTGQDVQRTTNTILNQILHSLERERGISENKALDTIQRLGSGTYRNDRDASSADLAGSIRTRTTSMSEAAKETAARIDGGRTSPQDTSDIRRNNFKNVTDDVMRFLPSSMKDSFQKVRDDLLSTNKGESSKNSGDYQRAISDLASQQKRLANEMKANNGGTEGQRAEYAQYSKVKNQFLALGAEGNAPKAAPTRTQGKQGTGKVGEVSESVRHDINVHIGGVVCEQCHKPVRPTTHSSVVSQNTY